MILVDYSGILLFFPLRRCYFFIFFSFSNYSRGLFSLLMRLLEFLSIIALSPAIFSMTSLNKLSITVRFEGREIPHRREVENRYQECFSMLFEIMCNSFELHRSYGNRICLFLCNEGCTYAEDVLWLFLYFFEDVGLFLLEEVAHFFEAGWIMEDILSIISSVTSARKSSI